MKRNWYMITASRLGAGEPVLCWPFHARSLSAAFGEAEKFLARHRIYFAVARGRRVRKKDLP